MNRLLFAAALSVVLSACGTGGGGNPPADPVTASDIPAPPPDLPAAPPDPGAKDVPPVPDTADPAPADTAEAATPPPDSEPALRIAILGPSGRPAFATTGGIVTLAGIVLGKAGSLTWQSSSGGIGKIDGAPYWTSDAVHLVPGDNVVTVYASNDHEKVSDTLTITYNPGLAFPEPVRFFPPDLFAGEARQVRVTVGLGRWTPDGRGDPKLVLVDGSGKHVQDLAVLKDDGNLPASSDEIAHDGVFSGIFPFDGKATAALRVRVSVPQADGTPALSPVQKLTVAPHLTVLACNAHKSTLAEARIAYQKSLSGGKPAALAAARDILQSDPDRLEVRASEDTDGLWILWTDGVLGALNLADPGTRGGGGPGVPPIQAPGATVSIQARSLLALSPFHSAHPDADEAFHAVELPAQLDCSPIVPAFRGDEDADLAAFRTMSLHGISVVATHADVYFTSLSQEAREAHDWADPAGVEVLWTGEQVVCENLVQVLMPCSSSVPCPAGTACQLTDTANGMGIGYCHDATQIDLLRGHAVLGDAVYGIAPSFVTRYADWEPFPKSLVYLGGCRTLATGSLALAFLASGAGAVVGYSGTVSDAFAYKTGMDLLNGIIVEHETIGEAFGTGAMDPAHPGSHLRLFGAEGLDAGDSGLVNAGFETGDLTGWTRDGDGRVISGLGVTLPAEGKRTGILSTGLGYTIQTGQLEQVFCLPPGAKKLTLKWKFYSEEFHEWCGSQFQDTFRAGVKQGNLAFDAVNVSVDDLCAKDDCNPSCGSQYVGLVVSDVQFDQGDTHAVPGWQTGTVDVSGLAATGGPVTLRLFCTDKGDSIYDTAVLVDDIRVE